MATKVCTKCGIEKDATEFHPYERTYPATGTILLQVRPSCRECNVTAARERRASPERIKYRIGKPCSKCGIALTDSDVTDGGVTRCMSCRVSYNKKWRIGHPTYEHDKMLELKKEMIAEYGGKCVCCGATELEFLTIDHIDGGGAAHRLSMYGSPRTGGGSTMYLWLKRNGWPKDNYRLLCFNCNCSIGFRGYCPHDINSETRRELIAVKPNW